MAGKLENEKHEVLKLYAYLEKIAGTDDNEAADIQELDNQFESCFHTKIKDPQDPVRLGLLTDPEFLSKENIGTPQRTEIQTKKQGDKKCLNGDSLLLRAISINMKENSPRKQILDKVINCILQYCPKLITFEKKHKNCEGVTPVHLAIVQEDKIRLENMADTLDKVVDKSQRREELKSISAVGAVFHDTVMMAGTLLGVASLKFNKEIFCFVLRSFVSEMGVTNEKGNNIIHSLIIYAHIQPEKLDSVLEMLGYEFIQKGSKYEMKKSDSFKLSNFLGTMCGI